jgi:glycerol kinase
MGEFLGAIDQGTTSTRFMVFDHGGNEVGRHQLEHQQILPRAGDGSSTIRWRSGNGPAPW